MNKERILIWGTGYIALQTFRECMTIDEYDIMGFIDNNKSKWGQILFDLVIYSPDYLFNHKDEVDKIVVLTDAYNEVKSQILNLAPELENSIENKYYFYKKSIFKRYKDCKDLEICKVLAYLSNHPLDVFNYDFVDKYLSFDPEVFMDEMCGLFYVLYKGKRMYFSRKYCNIEEVKKYYRSICLEQDQESPHRYMTDNFKVNKGDVVIDIGAAEGNFSLDIIDDVEKIYIIEADPLWIEALRYTFDPFKSKVIIIENYVSSYNEGKFVTIDSTITERIDFIKMDVEGCEWDALLGAQDTIKKADSIQLVICCYHSDFDQVLIENFFEKNNIRHITSEGYMWFPATCRQSSVSTCLHRGVIRATK